MDNKLRVTDYVKDATTSGLTPLGFFEEVLNVGIPTRTYTLIRPEDGNKFKLEGENGKTRHMAYVALHVVALIVFSVFTLIALAVREGLRAKLPEIKTGQTQETDGNVSVQYSKEQLLTLRTAFNQTLEKCEASHVIEVVIKDCEFRQVSDIFFNGNGKLCLHGMTVNNWGRAKIQNTVVVQGRQKGKDDRVGTAANDWPLVDHNALKGATVHYFHPELSKVDLEFTLTKPEGVLSDEAIEGIAKAIVEAIVETTKKLQVSTDFKGFHIEESGNYVAINPSDSLEEKINNIKSVIKRYDDLKNGSIWNVPLRIYLNYSLEDKVKVQELFQEEMSTALKKVDVNLKPSKFVSIKDCSSEFYFTNEGGKDNIKSSVRFIIDKLIKGESVSVFCSQGKDRSALIVFASLLYLSGDASEGNYTKVLNYIRMKRTVVSKYLNDFEKRAFIEPMLLAVRGMLDEEKGGFVGNNPVTPSNSGVVTPAGSRSESFSAPAATDSDSDFKPRITKKYDQSYWDEKLGVGEEQDGK